MSRSHALDSTFSYLQKEFLIPRSPHTRSSAGSRARPANAGTRKPRGLTRSAQKL